MVTQNNQIKRYNTYSSDTVRTVYGGTLARLIDKKDLSRSLVPTLVTASLL
jgi:hypothetical protein